MFIKKLFKHKAYSAKPEPHEIIGVIDEYYINQKLLLTTIYFENKESFLEYYQFNDLFIDFEINLMITTLLKY